MKKKWDAVLCTLPRTQFLFCSPDPVTVSLMGVLEKNHAT